MIKSKILGKSYKTKAAYKTQIRKYLKISKDNLEHIQSCEKRGWKTYLGDPIAKHRRAWEMEILRVEREIKINL